MSQPVGRFKFTLPSVNGDGRYGVALLLICALLLALALGGDPLFMALRYDRGALEDGLWWPLLTAHLVHLSLAHAALNVLGLVLLWALFARDFTPRQWLCIVLASMAAIDGGLWFRDPDVGWYVGASGVLHGVLAAGTRAHLDRREPDRWILSIFLLGKLTYEQFAGAMPFSDRIGAVVVNAHLYGALGGFFTAAIIAHFSQARRGGR